MKYVKKSAFTLAEILITLGVIGVVAAITMPVLVKNYQKHVTVNQLKKAYSEMAQAIQKAESAHGLLETWHFPKSDFGDSAYEQRLYFGENYLFPYLKIIKKCMPTSNECWSDDVVNLNDQEITAGSGYFTNRLSAISFVTASGYSVYYWLDGDGNAIWYVVDINGLKRPNKIGRDIFAFRIYWGSSEKIGYFPAGLPMHAREDILSGENLDSFRYYKCTKTKSSNPIGGVCAAVIFLDGWKISDDYPW